MRSPASHLNGLQVRCRGRSSRRGRDPAFPDDDAISVTDIDESLDEEGAKQRFSSPDPFVFTWYVV